MEIKILKCRNIYKRGTSKYEHLENCEQFWTIDLTSFILVDPFYLVA